ncbi:alpha/beta hydrolase [Aliikangiella marina]|uniref:Alpha/beta hydrolase n=1 Tax=Aliikangiella marina TaxID=1712262 RepID=A0A545T6S9_9GAMM|nr:alpha/beta hydrolase [Aliikangiella marina]TQV72937.1 alpha/beta hydrolase [Aliikangiella marina]
MKNRYKPMHRHLLAILMLPLFVLVGGCGSSSEAPVIDASFDEDNAQPTNEVNVGSGITEQANYTYEVIRDITYAKGSSHSSWNSDETQVIELKLDIYQTSNQSSQKPVVVFIHGGGFQSGDKATSHAAALVGYFAERGFIGISINYRLEGDYGTLPTELVNAIDRLPDLDEASRNQIKAIYPATRDAKAAIRWIYAHAETFGIDTNFITAIGGSAGSFISMGLGVSEPEDYTNEISGSFDTTLSSTHLDYPSKIHTIIDHWGGTGVLSLLEIAYGLGRWDSSDAPVSIVHGTEDTVVPFSEAEAIKAYYETNGVPFQFYPLEGIGHSAWSATVEGKGLPELAFDFIVQIQNITVAD